MVKSRTGVWTGWSESLGASSVEGSWRVWIMCGFRCPPAQPFSLVLCAASRGLHTRVSSFLRERPPGPFQSLREAQLISIFWDAWYIEIEEMTKHVLKFGSFTCSVALVRLCGSSSIANSIRSQPSEVLCSVKFRPFCGTHPTGRIFLKKAKKMGCSVFGCIFKIM